LIVARSSNHLAATTAATTQSWLPRCGQQITKLLKLGDYVLGT
jgi:hypothetical protein